MAKIEFTEKELEDYLCEGGRKGNLYKHLGLLFIARQVRTSVGTIDILSYHPISKTYFIIELKKDNLNSDAFFQVEKYRVHFQFHGDIANAERIRISGTHSGHSGLYRRRPVVAGFQFYGTAHVPQTVAKMIQPLLWLIQYFFPPERPQGRASAIRSD